MVKRRNPLSWGLCHNHSACGGVMIKSRNGDRKVLRVGEVYRGCDLNVFLSNLPKPDDIMAYTLTGKSLLWEQELVLASRTFSVPILVMKCLQGKNPETGVEEKDKSKAIGIGYNFARFADNGGEDSNAPLEVKLKFLEDYRKGVELLISSGSDRGKDFEEAKNIFARATKITRKYLVDDKERVFADNFGSSLFAFKSLPRKVKNSFFKHFDKMAAGMIHYLKNPPEKIEHLKDYNYHVAGLVGEFLTEVVSEMDGVQLMPTRAIPYGDYLQMANNIRDIGDDYRLRDKRIIWPSDFYKDIGVEAFMTEPSLKGRRRDILETMLDSAYESRDETFDYILSVPAWLVGYTAFSTIPAILADKTYEAIEDEESMEREDVFNLEGGVKIGRDEFKNVTSFAVKLADMDKDECKGRIHAFVRQYREKQKDFSFKDGEFEKWAPKYLTA